MSAEAGGGGIHFGMSGSVRAAALAATFAMLVLVLSYTFATWHFEPVRLPSEIPWHLAWGTA